MGFRIYSTITLFFLTTVLLISPSSEVSSQAAGCDTKFAPLTYNQEPVLDTIDGQFWAFSYCFNGNAGDIVNISMDTTSGDLDTYLELQDSNRTKLAENDDIDKNSKNSLIQYTLPTTGAYYISGGRYDGVNGKTSGGFSLSLSSSSSGSTQPGRRTSNTTNAAPTTNVCNNVAVDMAHIGAAFSAPTNQPLALLDNNPDTGWVSYGTTNELWFDVVLNGMQTVTSIEFNGYAFNGNPENSVNSFGLWYWDPDKLSADGQIGDFVIILENIVAPMQSGYQIYTFPPVTIDSLSFLLYTNHGGASLEVADVKVCTDTVTAGRPTLNTTTTNQTQPVAPVVAPTVPCTIQAKGSQAKTAEARLGIGSGRSVAGFLEIGKTYNVTGKNNDDDGSVWWSVDKYDVVSKVKGDNIMADFLYIAAAKTTASGDCDTVGEVSDSRMIRAPRPAPEPAVQPSTGSGNNTSEPAVQPSTGSGNNTSIPPQPIPQEGSTEQFISFYADPGYIFEAECTTLHWLVQNVKEVYFIDHYGSERRVTDPTGSGQETDCPTVPTGKITLLTYALRVVPLSGADVYQYVEVTVDANFIDIGPCTPSLPFLSDGGTLDDRSVETYNMFVEPCGDNAVAINVYVGKAGGDMDPYVYVNDTNGTYYGEDNDSGADFDALLNFCVFEASTIQIEVSNAFLDGTGDYYIQVTTKEQFCG